MHSSKLHHLHSNCTHNFSYSKTSTAIFIAKRIQTFCYRNFNLQMNHLTMDEKKQKKYLLFLGLIESHIRWFFVGHFNV